MRNIFAITLFTEIEQHRVAKSILHAPLVDDMGRRLHLVIQRLTRAKTDSQRALWHRWVGIIADHTGHTPGEVKRALKAEFLPLIETCDADGVLEMEEASSEGLDREDYSALITRTDAWAIDFLGLVLPHPRRYEQLADGSLLRAA